MNEALKKLREQHAAKVAEARAILTGTPGALTAELEARFDAIMVDADALEKRCKAEERAIEAERALQGRVANEAARAGRSTDEQTDRTAAYSGAFQRYMRLGVEGLNQEQRSLLQGGHVQLTDEERAQSVTGGSPAGIYGGYTVPQDFANQLDIAMAAYGTIMEAADVFDTATGATLPWPTTNDTSNKGAILGENQPITEQDITFGVVNFTSYTYTSKLIRASWQLLQDSAFDLEGLIKTMAGERIGRILSDHFTTGTGTAQPKGIVVDATLGVTALTQQTLSYDNLVDLLHSVDPAYREAPGARFMFNDSTLKILRKLKDADNRPLIWNADGSIATGVPAQLLGKPYTINQSMASVGAAAKTVLFGDMKKYKIRRVRDYVLVRLNERYADMLQTGFFVFARFDGRLVDAGTRPVKYLAQAAASP